LFLLLIIFPWRFTMQTENDKQVFGGTPPEKAGSQRSLQLRVGFALAGITALALLSMLASMVIADTASGNAAGINQAGSLRMHAYRLATLLEARAEPTLIDGVVEDFENILHGPKLRRVTSSGTDAVAGIYAQVSNRWSDDLRPLITAMESGSDVETSPGALSYLRQVDSFVESVDGLVIQLENQAETRIQWLRLIQAITIVLILTLALITMRLLHRGVITPLRDLMRAAEQASCGDLSVRARHTKADEIGLLGKSFNTMIERLQEKYGDLEQQVKDKTRALRHSNQSLTLLYDAARMLTPLDLNGNALPHLIDRLRESTNADAITLRLSEPGATLPYHTCSTPPGRSLSPTSHTQGSSGLHVAGGVVRNQTSQETITIPLVSGAERHGLLLVQYPRGETPASWKLQLADTLAERFAMACAQAFESRKQGRLALMEERSVIARELHDSLAQSLSYLKIQVSRLRVLQRREGAPAEMGPVITELGEGLNTAYRHLRELLTTFRLQMTEAGLESALQGTVEEFRQCGYGLDIRLNLAITGTPLDADAEIHLLQISREALANVVHHARASHAVVSLMHIPDGRLQLAIEDNGIGLPDKHDKTQHFGLHIMRERAASLGGALTLNPGREGGTRVEVRFPGRPKKTINQMG